jgi:hypothetical protein
MTMAQYHYYAIAERGRDGGWFLTFPGGGAGFSVADSVEEIVSQGQDWLKTAAMDGGQLPLSIEGGAKPPADLSEFESPLLVVIPLEPAAVPTPAA